MSPLPLSSIHHASHVGQAMEVSVNATQSSDAAIADLPAQLKLSRAEVLTLRSLLLRTTVSATSARRPHWYIE
jgi:hypothetical protein